MTTTNQWGVSTRGSPDLRQLVARLTELLREAKIRVPRGCPLATEIGDALVEASRKVEEDVSHGH